MVKLNLLMLLWRCSVPRLGFCALRVFGTVVRGVLGGSFSSFALGFPALSCAKRGFPQASGRPGSEGDGRAGSPSNVFLYLCEVTLWGFVD